MNNYKVLGKKLIAKLAILSMAWSPALPGLSGDEELTLESFRKLAQAVGDTASEEDIQKVISEFYRIKYDPDTAEGIDAYIDTFTAMSENPHIRPFMAPSIDRHFFSTLLVIQSLKEHEESIKSIRSKWLRHCSQYQTEFCESDLEWGSMYAFAEHGLWQQAFAAAEPWAIRSVLPSWKPKPIAYLEFQNAYAEAKDKWHGYSIIADFMLKLMDAALPIDGGRSSLPDEIRDSFIFYSMRVDGVLDDYLQLDLFSQILATFDLDHYQIIRLKAARSGVLLRMGKITEAEIEILEALASADSDDQYWNIAVQYIKYLTEIESYSSGRRFTEALIERYADSPGKVWKLKQFMLFFSIKNPELKHLETALSESIEYGESLDLGNYYNASTLYYSYQLMSWYQERLGYPDDERLDFLRRAYAKLSAQQYGQDRIEALWRLESIRYMVLMLEKNYEEASLSATKLKQIAIVKYGSESDELPRLLAMEAEALYWSGNVALAKQTFLNALALMKMEFEKSDHCTFNARMEAEVIRDIYSYQEIVETLDAFAAVLIEKAEAGRGVGALDQCRDGVSGTLMGYAQFGPPVKSSAKLVGDAFLLAQVLEYGSLNKSIDLRIQSQSLSDDRAVQMRENLQKLRALRHDYREAIADGKGRETLKEYSEEIRRLHGEGIEISDVSTSAQRKPLASYEWSQSLRSLDDIALQIEPDAALLKYQFLGPDDLVVFQLTREKSLMHYLKVDRDALGKLVREIRDSVDQSDVSSYLDIRPFNINAAAEVYEQIFQPLMRDLEQKAVVYVVADGPLKQLPLEILPIANPALPVSSALDFGRYREVSWLIDKFEFRYLPTINSMALAGREKRVGRSSSTFLGFGNPEIKDANVASYSIIKNVFESKILFQGVKNQPDLASFAPLPQAGRQLSAIGKLYSGSNTIYLGKAASERKLRTLDLSGYDAIAFATHGLLDGSYTTEAALLLAPEAGPAASSPGDSDGLLTASEIAMMDLDTDFVALSACNTATPSSAEGLTSLSQAFIYAGARNVLATHWSVDANASADLLEYAFSAPAAGQSIAGLVRDAKLKMLREDKNVFYAHPLFWGGFVTYAKPTIH